MAPSPGAPRGIVTPEAVVLDFETAGMASRMLAAGIDLLVQGALLLSVALAAAGLAGLGVDVGGLGGATVYFSVFLLVFGYPAGMETLWRGRTLGKAALGLRVVTVEGGPIRFRHAAIRAIVGILDKYLLSGAIGIISVLLSPRNQRLGDLVAGTLVLRERSGAKAPTAVTFQPPRGLEGYTASLDVARLGHEEYGAVRSFLLRASSLSPQSRDTLAAQLASPLLVRLHTSPPPGVGPGLFLACVAAAYQARHGARPPAPPAPAPTFTSVWADAPPPPAPPGTGPPPPSPAPAPAPAEGGFVAPG